MRKDWEYKKLGEVANVVMGQSPDGSNVNNENGMEFHQGKINFGEQFLMKSDCFTTQVTKVAEKGSILLCVRAPIGIINITDRDICIGRGLCAIKEKTEVDNLFLYYYLLNKKLYFEKNSTGSTFKAISSKVVLNTPIFLPPKPTQLAIVAELDKLNEMIRLKKQQLEDYDQLAQSIFYEMFGDPVENEKGWEVKKLGEVCEVTSSKRIFADDYVEKGIPFYRSKEVIEKSKNLPISVELFITEEKYNNINKSYGVPQIDDILITAVGTIGKIWKVNTIEPFYFKDGNIIWIRKYNEINSTYFKDSLYYLIDEFKKVNANGAAYNALTIIKLKQMQVPLPPLPLQQQFAARIEAIERQKQQVSETIKDLETLLASRMQYWFD